MTDTVNQKKGYYDLAPGNVLQNLYIKKRLNKYVKPSMKFVELGAGNGNISKILLDNGLIGVGYDLSDVACSLNYEKNKTYIDANRYQVKNEDFFDASNSDQVDIIISSHVLEHMPSDLVNCYFEKCKSIIGPEGKIISLVPSNM